MQIQVTQSINELEFIRKLIVLVVEERADKR